MTALLDNNVDWVPLMVNYFFLNDEDDTRLCFVPRTVMEIGRLILILPTLVLRQDPFK